MVFRGFLWIPRILTELQSEKFEWFGPSPIEPFNSGAYGPLLDAEPGHVDSVDGAVQLWLARSGRLRWT